MSAPDDGPWDPATEHDDQRSPGGAPGDGDSDEIDDNLATVINPNALPSALAQRARARANRSQLPSTTLPPPAPDRLPAVSTTPPAGVPIQDAATRRPHDEITPVALPAVTQAQLRASHPDAGPEDVIMLDRVARSSSAAAAAGAAGHAATPTAAGRADIGAGGHVIVATGSDSERVRKLCHANGLHLPVMASLSVVDDAVSVIVIGEPSPPAPDRVVHVARPSLPDDSLLALLRALVGGRALIDPPAPATDADPRVNDFAQRLGTLDDRGAIEMIAIEAITALAGADRAHLLFHDPLTGALWSESRKRSKGDTRRAMGGIVGWCAHTGHSVHASPAGDDPRYLTELDDPDGKAQSRIVVQPVIGADRRVHAVLVAARRWRHNDFSDAERANLKHFAARISATIDLASASTGSDGQGRKARSTLPGVTSAKGSEAATQSALVSTPRAASDSRPPPVTARRADSKPPPITATPAAGVPAASASTSGAAIAAALAAAPASSSSAAVPTAAAFGSPPPDSPASTSPGFASAVSSGIRPPSTATPASGSPATTSGVRAKSNSDAQRTKSISDSPRNKRSGTDVAEPHDLAVVASDPDDVARAQKIARKSRLEISVLSRTEDAPPYYRIVTIGQPWTPDTDARVVYAARSGLSDEHLTDLLNGLATDRAPAPPVQGKPQSAAEAKRLQLAFASSRKLATAADLVEGEAIATAAVRELVDADRAYCLFFDASDGALWSESRERQGGDDRRAIAGIVGWAARTGRTAFVERASADPRWLGPLDDADGDPNSQIIAQPIVTGDRRVVGVLVAVRRPKRAGFGELDVTVLGRFAALAAPLLEQLELAVETQHILRESGGPDDHELRAVDSPVKALLRRANELPRWSFAAGGAVVMLLLFLIARC